jgi:acyl-CoA reductase-like NAD-dependent aldehyde dehydrogenase
MPLRLYVDTMDAVVVEVSADGAIRLEHEDWRRPSFQERRAIIYAATNALEELKELIDILQDAPSA